MADRAANDPGLDPEHRGELLAAAGQVIAAAGIRDRERRLVGLRALDHSRREMAALTGESYRTVDRKLTRAQRRLAARARVGRICWASPMTGERIPSYPASTGVAYEAATPTW